MSEKEEMPCPRCGKLHARGDYIPRPDIAKKPLGKMITHGKYAGKVQEGTPFAPPDVECECGATLRHTVPLFRISIYGWHWSVL